MNNITGRALTGLDHLRQSIAIIVGTPLGSRVMRRDFGSLVPSLIDHPDNGATRVRLYAAVAGALMKWEPRLRISRVQLFSGPNPGQAELEITGLYVPLGQKPTNLSLRLPLQSSAAV